MTLFQIIPPFEIIQPLVTSAFGGTPCCCCSDVVTATGTVDNDCAAIVDDDSDDIRLRRAEPNRS